MQLAAIKKMPSLVRVFLRHRASPISPTGELCGKILDTVNRYLDRKGIRISTGTIVDATIIAARSSTNNEKRERDPEMHQTRNGIPWYFGMKAHIGVDSKASIVRSVCATAASVSDVHMPPDLLHGGEKKVCHPANEGLFAGTPVWVGAGYQGQTEVIREAALQAQDMTCRRVKTKAGVHEAEKLGHRTMSRARMKVEWPFRILKRVFGFTKVPYRGLKKNHQWLCASFALAKLWQNRKRLAGIDRQTAPQGAQCAPRQDRSGLRQAKRATETCENADLELITGKHDELTF